MAVYPNSFTDKLTVTIGGQTGESVITIVDLLGRTAYQGTRTLTAGTAELSVPQLKAGVYLLKLQTETGATQTLRIVKQ